MLKGWGKITYLKLHHFKKNSKFNLKCEGTAKQTAKYQEILQMSEPIAA